MAKVAARDIDTGGAVEGFPDFSDAVAELVRFGFSPTFILEELSIHGVWFWYARTARAKLAEASMSVAMQTMAVAQSLGAKAARTGHKKLIQLSEKPNYYGFS